MKTTKRLSTASLGPRHSTASTASIDVPPPRFPVRSNTSIFFDQIRGRISIGSTSLSGGGSTVSSVAIEDEAPKAKVLCTWVPKTFDDDSQEITVIGGEIVQIVNNDPFDTLKTLLIEKLENESKNINKTGNESKGNLKSIDENDNENETESGKGKRNENENDKDIHNVESMLEDVIHDGMHWTMVQTRKQKQGIVPSIILRYVESEDDDPNKEDTIYTNPIGNIWCKVRVSFSYSAKTDQEIDVLTGERVLIYGYCLSNGMILAKNKREETGYIPIDFIEIPPISQQPEISNLGTIAASVGRTRGSIKPSMNRDTIVTESVETPTMRGLTGDTNETNNIENSEYTRNGKKSTYSSDIPINLNSKMGSSLLSLHRHHSTNVGKKESDAYDSSVDNNRPPMSNNSSLNNSGNTMAAYNQYTQNHSIHHHAPPAAANLPQIYSISPSNSANVHLPTRGSRSRFSQSRNSLTLGDAATKQLKRLSKSVSQSLQMWTVHLMSPNNNDNGHNDNNHNDELSHSGGNAVIDIEDNGNNNSNNNNHNNGTNSSNVNGTSGGDKNSNNNSPMNLTDYNMHASASTASPYDIEVIWRKVEIIRNYDPANDSNTNVMKPIDNTKPKRDRNDTGVSDVTDFGDIDNRRNRALSGIPDKLKVSIGDNIEVTGDITPSHYILARFCNQTHRRGYIPIDNMQYIEKKSNKMNENKRDKKRTSYSTTANSMNREDYIMAAVSSNKQMQQIASSQNEAQTNIQMVEDTPSSTAYDAKFDGKEIALDSGGNRVNTANDTELRNESRNASRHESRQSKLTMSNQASPKKGTNGTSGSSKTGINTNNQSNIDWPFSQTYNKYRRSWQSKGIETALLTLVGLIYALPVFFDDPEPSSMPTGYQLWFAHLFGSLIPFLILLLIRLIELWNIKFFDRRYNENNFYLGRFFFYLIFFIHAIGLFAVIVEFNENIEFVRDNSTFLYFTCLMETIIFGFLIFFICGYIILLCIAIFCCQITRNRWEMRVVWKMCCVCCQLGQLNNDGHRTQRIQFQQ